MKNQEIIDNINGFSSAQKPYFNQNCDNKVYNNQNGPLLQADQDEATDTADALNLLSSADVDSKINPNLNNTNKLSRRPC